MSIFDSLSVGDIVTVTANTRMPSDHSFQGDPLVVVAIEPPFIAVKSSRLCNHAFPLDTRDFTLMRISREYFDAVNLTDRHSGSLDAPTVKG